MMDWNSLKIPPLTIWDYHPDKWDTWFRNFKLHIFNTPFPQLSDSEKVAVLLLKLGTEITPIFDTFCVDVDNISYNELVRRFTIYFYPAKARNVFLNLRQKSGETFEQFAERLRVLSYPCGFGPFRDGFLRDVFLKNMDDKYGNVRVKILDSFTDPGFVEVVGVANKLLLEECSMGSATVSDTVSYGSGVSLESKMSHDASQGNSRSQNRTLKGPRRSNDFGRSFPTFTPINPGDTVDVLILAAHKDSLHVCPTNSEGSRKQFFKLLNESLNKSSTQVQAELSKRYAAKLKGEWYRVVVESVQDSSRSASVQSLDFGWWETIHFSEFRMLPLDFVGVSPLALNTTFGKPQTRTFRVGQHLRLTFVDAIERKKNEEKLWSVRLVDSDSDSSNGLNMKKPNRRGEDCGGRNMSGADGLKLMKIQLHDSHSTEDTGSTTDYEVKGYTSGGKHINMGRQSLANRNNFRPIEQKPGKFPEQDVNSKNDTGGTGHVSRGNRSFGKEQHKKKELSSFQKMKCDNKGYTSSNGPEFKENLSLEGAHKLDQNAGKSLKNDQISKMTQEGDVDVGRDVNNGFIGNGFKGNRSSDGVGNRRPSGGNDERRSRNPGATSSIDDSHHKGANHLKDDHNGNSSGFRRSGIGKNQPELTTKRPNCGGMNNNDGCKRPNGGNRTQIGDERGSGSDNRRSGGERCSHGTKATLSNDPIPDLAKLQLVDDPPIPSDRFTKVMVVHQVDEKVAYVYPECSKNQFQDMLAQLQMVYNDPTNRTEVIKHPKKGVRCAAPFLDEFYRAEVREVLNESSAKVFYFDFGNEDIVPCNELKVLSKELLVAPCVSFPIEVPDSFDIVDIPCVIEVRSKCMKGRTCVVDIKERNNGSPNQDSSSLVVDTGSSRSTNTSRAQHLDDVVRSNKTSPCQPPGVQTHRGAEGVRSTSASSRTSNNSQVQPVDHAPMRAPKPPIPKNMFSEVRVVYTGTEGTFVVPGDKIQMMLELLGAVNEAVGNQTPCSMPLIGKVYAAPYDGEMYRAKVLSIDRNESSCHVEFLDFGNVCDVATGDLVELPPALIKPEFIFKIKLDLNCDVILNQGDDLNISPITSGSDGSWLVQLEGEPLAVDYQLPEPSEPTVSDSFITFTRNPAEGGRKRNGPK